MGGGDKIEETEMQKELAEIATEKWNLSKRNLQPLEDMLIVDTKRGVTEQQRAKVSSAAGLSSQREFGQASKGALKSLAASGVDPTSGKARETLSDISRAGGESRAAAEVEGEAGLQANLVGKEMNLLRVGAGEATQAQSSISDIASRSAQKAAFDKQQAIAENQGLRQLAGTIGGAAAGYYGSGKTASEFDKEHAKKFGVTG